MGYKRRTERRKMERRIGRKDRRTVELEGIRNENVNSGTDWDYVVEHGANAADRAGRGERKSGSGGGKAVLGENEGR